MQVLTTFHGHIWKSYYVGRLLLTLSHHLVKTALQKPVEKGRKEGGGERENPSWNTKNVGRERGKEGKKEGGWEGSISTASSLFKGTSSRRKGPCPSPSTSLFPVLENHPVVLLLVFRMTKPHGSLILPQAAWRPLPSSSSACRAQQGCRPGHATRPFPPSFPHTHTKGCSHWWSGRRWGLAWALQVPTTWKGPSASWPAWCASSRWVSFLLFSVDRAQNRIDAHKILGTAFFPRTQSCGVHPDPPGLRKWKSCALGGCGDRSQKFTAGLCLGLPVIEAGPRLLWASVPHL